MYQLNQTNISQLKAKISKKVCKLSLSKQILTVISFQVLRIIAGMEGTWASKQLQKHTASIKHCTKQILNINLIKLIQSVFCLSQENNISQTITDLLNISSNRNLKANHLYIQPPFSFTN